MSDAPSKSSKFTTFKMIFYMNLNLWSTDVKIFWNAFCLLFESTNVDAVKTTLLQTICSRDKHNFNLPVDSYGKKWETLIRRQTPSRQHTPDWKQTLAWVWLQTLVRGGRRSTHNKWNTCRRIQCSCSFCNGGPRRCLSHIIIMNSWLCVLAVWILQS